VAPVSRAPPPPRPPFPKAFLRAGRSVVVDRCNFNPKQRAPWVRLAAAARVPAVAVELALPTAECARRAAARGGHPTIPPADAPAVVARMAADYRAVDGAREGFAGVTVCATDAAARAAVRRLGPGRAGPPRADLAALAAASATPWASTPRVAPAAGNAVPFRRAAPGGRGRPPQPGSLAPRHLDGPLGLDPRPICLFDLNDTLASSTAVRRAAGRIRARPGGGALLALKQKLRFGLYTSATLPTVRDALPILAAAAGGCLFGEAGAARQPAADGGPPLPSSLILHRGHTAPAPAGEGDPRKAWATVKPVAPWFSEPARVLVVDDDATKAAAGEAAHFVVIPAWGAAEAGDCRALVALAAALDAHVAPLAPGADARPAGAAVAAAVRAAVEKGAALA
jgi:hypothetical protein